MLNKKKLSFVGCLAVVLSTVSVGAFAKRSIDIDSSQINFISIKNEHIAESHSFDRFSGSVSEAGLLEISIDLASVNTLIPIRNERMQAMLFNVGMYPSANFTAQIQPDWLTLKAGQQQSGSVQGTLKIQDTDVTVNFDVLITMLNDGRLQASTIKPTLISTTNLGLDSGVDALREIAMLKSISRTVPLSFSVVFSK